ncbi:hypothetical protein [Pseudomonas coronafaciens]|uniref:hypothetical protein n=1 Tax=Pseudomonas coronafaciens TaxID=53409 RepID=UPI0011C37FCE|nr:hypothetical protein [Pseudomonas coronafaciens]
MKYTSLKHLIYSVGLTLTFLIAAPAFADDSGVTTFPQPDSGSIDTGTTSYGAPDSLSTSPLVTSGGLGTSSDSSVGTGTTVSALTQREKLVATGIWLMQKAATFSGMLILVALYLRITQYANAQGTQNRPSVSSLFIYAIAGTMLFSYNSSLGTLIVTISGQSGDGVCYVVEAPDATKLNSLSNCWSDASSEVSGALAANANKLSGDANVMTEFSENVKVGVGLLQMIGFMFFIFSVKSLVEVGKGTARHGYFKPSVMLIASCLIVDLPHTFAMILATLKSVGVTISA